MNKTINFCGNCPFFHTEYDDFAVGMDTTNMCCLAYNLKQEEYVVSYCNSHECENDEIVDKESSDFGTPEWCPLKKDEYSFSFKPFSKNRLDDINLISKQIEELNDFLDHTDDYESVEFVDKMKQSTDLNNKFSELLKNEELSFDDSFQRDINKSVDEIKVQMAQIENATAKLQDVLINLGKDENN